MRNLGIGLAFSDFTAALSVFFLSAWVGLIWVWHLIESLSGGKSLSPNKIKNHYFAVVFIFSTGNENVIDANSNPGVTDFNQVKQLKYFLYLPYHVILYNVATKMFWITILNGLNDSQKKLINWSNKCATKGSPNKGTMWQIFNESKLKENLTNKVHWAPYLAPMKHNEDLQTKEILRLKHKWLIFEEIVRFKEIVNIWRL